MASHYPEFKVRIHDHFLLQAFGGGFGGHGDMLTNGCGHQRSPAFALVLQRGARLQELIHGEFIAG
jgi:hypothetical protein